MHDAIIVLNAGSSSLKFSLYSVRDQQLSLEARGQIENLGTSPRFIAKDEEGRTLANVAVGGPPGSVGHPEAITYLTEWIRQFRGKFTLVAIGHRMAHGGLKYDKPTRIDAEVIEQLEQLIPLVPLHQPHNLAGVRAAMQQRPDLPQVACFDTAFHRGRDPVTERYGLPDDLFQRGLRRWGFHGLSYESIASQLPNIAPEVARGRVIVAHLGSGASLCAMKNCRSVDTTMGFSALDGLPMGTRCGSLDPGVVLFLLKHKSPDQIEDLLYRQSGLKGVSGISNDVRELLASSSPLAAAAIDFFVYRAAREIGSLTAALGGLDALVFTAGIGENSPVIRQRIYQRLEWLGVRIDPKANEARQRCISAPGESPSVWVVPTDEEFVIAAETLAIVNPAA